MNEIEEQVLELFKTDYFDNVKWKSHRDKYNDVPICFNDGHNMWNYQVCQLEGFTPKKQFAEFYEWLGQRIQLSLNLNRGLTNEQIKEKLNEQERI